VKCEVVAVGHNGATTIRKLSCCVCNYNGTMTQSNEMGKKRKRGGFFFLEIRQPDEFRFVQVLNNFKGLIFPKFNYSIV
jgi:hypothetical protein